jgi:hypothetical protein
LTQREADMTFEIDAMASRRRLLAGLGGLGLMGVAGCAPGQVIGKPGLISSNGLAPFDIVPPLAPFRMRPDRISKITVCLRPFRKAGPRLDVETVGDKTVVHNYGHGGSGWSLSWGSGTIATKNALSTGERDIAVIGCGALGLTAATLLRRAGANVTIYASERTPYTRSARATGTWSPDSRIAAVGSTAPGFEAQWEEMCRTSYKAYQTYVGLAGDRRAVDRSLHPVRHAVGSGKRDAVGSEGSAFRQLYRPRGRHHARVRWSWSPASIRSRPATHGAVHRCSSTSPNTPIC